MSRGQIATGCDQSDSCSALALYGAGVGFAVLDDLTTGWVDSVSLVQARVSECATVVVADDHRIRAQLAVTLSYEDLSAMVGSALDWEQSRVSRVLVVWETS